jgi:hypothetical protein
MCINGKPTLAEVKEAVEVILGDTEKYETSLNYAVKYCRYAMIIDNDYEMDMQVRYILNNITHWRHPMAKYVRNTLKRYIK